MRGLKELHISLYHPRVCSACIHPVRCVVLQYHKKTDPGVTVGDPKLLTCLSAALGLRYFWTRFPRGNKAWPATAQRCCGLPAAFSSWKKERTCWPTALPGSPETKGFPKIRSSGSFQLSGKVSGCGAGPQEKQKPLQATKKGVQWKCLVVKAISRSGVLLVQNSYPGDHLVMWISSTGYCCRVVLLLQGEVC